MCLRMVTMAVAGDTVVSAKKGLVFFVHASIAALFVVAATGLFITAAAAKLIALFVFNVVVVVIITILG